MSRRMLVDAVHSEETRVVIVDHKSSILEFDFTTAAKPQVKGNVYLAKITRVEPSLQAAFVEYGGGKQGFLPFSEIHPNYYQIPVSDRQRLLEEEEEEAARDREEEEDEAYQHEESPAEVADHEVVEERHEERDAIEIEEIEVGEGDAYDSIAAEAVPMGESIRSEEIPESLLEPELELRESDSAAENTENTQDADPAQQENGAAEGAASDNGDSSRSRRRRGGRFRNRRRGGRDRGEGRGEGRGENENRRERPSDEDSAEVETLSGEDDIVRPQRQRNYMRRYKIQEVIKRNQVLLVQVIKEERGNKGVSLTTFLSLAGRYCVLMPNSPRGGGVSRKIGSGEDRKRLKEAMSDLALPQGMSVIIRTAGAGHTRTEIKRDFDYLVKVWNQIREDTLQASAPALIYEESHIIQRSLRDSYSPDIEEVLVDGEEAFKETKAFMRKLMPSHAPRVKLYKGETPLFHREGIEDQLTSMMEPQVRLPSGGSIVMVPTEALISIDVNSGRSTRERNVEETAVKTNMEAAREIARQLRLRDLAGLIVIDFIDMMEGRNRRAVERAMKEALRNDRAKIQVGRISSFGLMEMSRQRMRPSLAESVNRACPHCKGTGFIRSEAALAIQIVRALEKDAATGQFDRFRVSVTAAEALHMLNHMRGELDKLESQFNCNAEIVIDGTLFEGNFRIEKMRRKFGEGAAIPSAKAVSAVKDEDEIDEGIESETTDGEENASENTESENKPRRDRERGGRGRRNRRDRGRGERNREETVAQDNTPTEPVEDAVTEETAASEPVVAASPRRGRPSRTKPAVDESPAESAARETEKPVVQVAPVVDPDTKPTGRKRSGWWQRIVE